MPAIAFDYPQEVLALREGLVAFLRSEVMARHDEQPELFENPHRVFDERGAYRPEVLGMIRDVRMASAKAGYYAMSAPESLGGGGLGHLAYFVAWEQIFRSCGARYWLGHHAISHWAKGPSPVLSGLTEAFRRAHLARLMSGEDSMCFALSEPGAGSDALAIKTRARPDGDGWRLTGSKIWISNSPYAQLAVVFAVTDPEAAARRKGGISAFMVPTNAPGFRVERLINMFGHVGTDEAILQFDDVRIEPWQLVGELNKGFRISMLGVSLGRIYNSARAVGLGRWALETAVEYTKARETFGRKLSEYQGVTFPLAESAMHLHAAHLMALNVCQLLDRGLPALKELSMTKAFAVEHGRTAVDRAMQVHGAMGFTNEMHLSEAYVILRRANVADGAGEIMRNTIVRQLLAGDTDV
ncbi:MAG: acyl-CoA dehydrogenase [Rhodocyclaceae bacterium]|nr:acyl-CoA dehydrogenase [Rhodocyclaceae bacterium]